MYSEEQKIYSLLYSGQRANIELALQLGKAADVEIDRAGYREIGEWLLGHHHHFRFSDEIDMIEKLMNLKEIRFDYYSSEIIYEVPESLGLLYNLRYLNLDNFNLKVKSLPESIGNLINLEGLRIIKLIELTSLPESIGNLKNLKLLEISGNYNLRILPESLGELNRLEKLTISIDGRGYYRHQYEHEYINIPQSIGKLKKLFFLDLSYCMMPQLPGSIGNLENLEELRLEGNRSLTALPDSITKLRQLQVLNLSDMSLNHLPENMGAFENLRKLSLDNNSELKKLPDSIINLSHLRSLTLSGCPRLKLPEHIPCNLNQLEYDNNNAEQIPECFFKLRSLFRLSLKDNNIDKLPIEITEVRSLGKLNLKGNSLRQLPPEIMKMTGLKELNLIKNLFKESYLQVFRKKLRGCKVIFSDPKSKTDLLSLIQTGKKGDIRFAVEMSKNNKIDLSEYNLLLDWLGANGMSCKSDKTIEKLYWLTNIKKLVLANKNISRLPESIYLLSGLEELDLSNNLLTVLPENITKLRSLKKLNISSNKLNDLPLEFFRLYSLKLIDIRNNPQCKKAKLLKLKLKWSEVLT
jgi:Leucine-rich repeat (LRR) protein